MSAKQVNLSTRQKHPKKRSPCPAIDIMNNGMSILGIGIDWQQTIKGLVLFFVAFFDVYNKNKNVYQQTNTFQHRDGM